MNPRLLALAALLIAILAIATGPRSKAPENVLKAVYAGVAVDVAPVTLLPSHDRDSVVCAALTVYHEARAESLEGRMAVAAVIRNRMRERALPACGVVFENLQFSWTVWPVANQVPRDPTAWARSLKEAYAVLVVGEMEGFAFNHFVNPSVVRPSWLKSAAKRQMIGNHLFLYLPPRRRWCCNSPNR